MRKKILVIAQECNPEWVSVPRVSFQIVNALSKVRDITLVTHKRNEQGFSKLKPNYPIHYIDDNKISRYAHAFANKLSVNKRYWPIYHTCALPVHHNFCKNVEKKFHNDIIEHKYDIVHIISPMIPRYHAPLVDICHQHNIPLILGPVNGGLSYPKGFYKILFSEAGFLRPLINLYHKNKKLQNTYKKATKIICGAHHVANHLKSPYPFLENKIVWMPENGISEGEIISSEQLPSKSKKKIEMIFVGRLVPYKGCRYIIEALQRINKQHQNWNLKIIGDGVDFPMLDQLVKQSGLSDKIHFHKWLDRNKVLTLLEKSHLMVFPSIREFGGGVLMEALAKGCPCLIANRGGPADIITKHTGYKIDFNSEKDLIDKLSKQLIKIIQNPKELFKKKKKCLERARLFTWSHKADLINKLYHNCSLPLKTLKG